MKQRFTEEQLRDIIVATLETYARRTVDVEVKELKKAIRKHSVGPRAVIAAHKADSEAHETAAVLFKLADKIRFGSPLFGYPAIPVPTQAKTTKPKVAKKSTKR